MMTGHKSSFFCTRPDGTLTPLIPADELPIGLVIRGLSRVITAGETQGMTSCGVAIHRPENWIIESYGESRPSVSTPELLEKLRKIFVEVLKIESAPAQLRQEVSDLLTKGLENVIVAHTAAPKSKALVPAASNTARNGPRGAFGHQKPQVALGEKEFCSFWIRHGECDYQQQGCLYRHQMPIDPEGLAYLGLRDIPRWYREKYHLPSLLLENGLQAFLAYLATNPLPPDAIRGVSPRGLSPSGVIPPTSLVPNSSVHTNGNMYHRGNFGRGSKSPRGGGVHGKNRGHSHIGHHKNGQNGQNGANSQVVVQTPRPQRTPPTSTAQSPPKLPTSQQGSTFAQVVARANNLNNSEPSSGSDSKKSTSAAGQDNATLPQPEKQDDGQSKTHKSFHQTIMDTKETPNSVTQVTRQVDAFGLPLVTKTEEDFHKGSRRLFENPSLGNDGADDFVDVFEHSMFVKDLRAGANFASSDAIKPGATIISLNALFEESEPLQSERALATWGPVGKEAKQSVSMDENGIHATSFEGVTHLKLVLSETEGTPGSGNLSAIGLAQFSYRFFIENMRKGNGDVAAAWKDLACQAHAKAAFVWRLKVNREFGMYSKDGPDVYTAWRRKRDVHDFPYVTGNRADDLAEGFRVPFPSPRECSKRDTWLLLHKQLIAIQLAI